MWDECAQGPNPISFSFRQSIWLTVLRREDSMVSKKVVRFPRKVAVQGYSSLCFGKVPMGAKAYLKTVGSEAYVQFPTFVAINEGCVCTCESLMEGVRCVDPWLAWVQKSLILGWLGFRNL